MFAFTDRSWLLRYVPNRSDRTEGNQREKSQGRASVFWSIGVMRSLSICLSRKISSLPLTMRKEYAVGSKNVLSCSITVSKRATVSYGW